MSLNQVSSSLAVFEDTDGETVEIKVGMDAQFRHCVVLTTRADMTFEKAAAYLDPAAARAIAQALEAAAGNAELRTLDES
jgi:hypothetical protein